MTPALHMSTGQASYLLNVTKIQCEMGQPSYGRSDDALMISGAQYAGVPAGSCELRLQRLQRLRRRTHRTAASGAARRSGR